MLCMRIIINKVAIRLFATDSFVLEEQIAMAESLGLTWSIVDTESDSMELLEDILFSIDAVLSDTVTISETLDLVATFIMDTLADTVTMSEDYSHSFGLADPAESVTMSENYAHGFGLADPAESMTVSETYDSATTFNDVESETITMSESFQTAMIYNYLINGQSINQRAIG